MPGPSEAAFCQLPIEAPPRMRAPGRRVDAWRTGCAFFSMMGSGSALATN
jgi:hypothetical protein